jgi:hypothetical protein
MHKISLDIDDLAVESFDTVDADGKKLGTVRGHDQTGDSCDRSDCASCSPFGCPGDTVTCFGSCRNSQYYPGGPCEPYIDGNC